MDRFCHNKAAPPCLFMQHSQHTKIRANRLAQMPARVAIRANRKSYGLLKVYNGIEFVHVVTDGGALGVSQEINRFCSDHKTNGAAFGIYRLYARYLSQQRWPFFICTSKCLWQEQCCWSYLALHQLERIALGLVTFMKVTLLLQMKACLTAEESIATSQLQASDT